MAPPAKPRTPGALAVQPGGDWDIGVNFAGLSQLAGELYGHIPREEETVSTVNRSLTRILDRAGWRGQAADAFVDAWNDDLTTIKKLSDLKVSLAEEIDGLAVSLSWLQKAMNDRAIELGPMRDDQPPETGAGTVDPRQKALDNYREEARKLQEKTAEKLVAIYSGKDGNTDLINLVRELKKDGDLPGELKNPLSDADKKLIDGLPNDWWDEKASTNWGDEWSTWGNRVGAPIGGIIGWAIGGVVGVTNESHAAFGTVAGAATGGAIGESAGGLIGSVLGGLFGPRRREQ